MRRESSGFLFFSLLLSLVVLSGCAAKLPQTLPLGPNQQEEAECLLTSFFQIQRPKALDADLRLGWDVFGHKGSADAILQVQQPAFLRCTVTDPLGRSLLLAVSDGTSFTLVDNRIGCIYQGKTDSEFWYSYMPEDIRPEDLFFLLGGLLPNVEMEAIGTTQNPERTGFWYVWQDSRSLIHHAFLNRRSKEMTRHLLLDARENLLLDIVYSNYSGLRNSGFNWPRHLQLTGTAISGTLTVQINTLYSHRQLAAAIFHLVPPPHFPVEEVR